MSDCLSPVTVRGLRVRCGKCLNCQRFEARGVVNMLKAEAVGCAKVWFLTLTYASSIPIEDGRKDVGEFVRHLRQVLDRAGSGRDQLRFGAFPEFGERKGRFHYHLIIYGPKELKWKHFDWWRTKHGFFKANIVTEDGRERTIKEDGGDKVRAFDYVAKYVTKQGNGAKRTFSKHFGFVPFSAVAEVSEVAALLEAFPRARIKAIRPHGSTAFDADGRAHVDRAVEAYFTNRIKRKGNVIDASDLFRASDPCEDAERRAILDRIDVGELVETVGEFRDLPKGFMLVSRPGAEIIERTSKHQSDAWIERIREMSLTGEVREDGVPVVRALSEAEIERVICEAPEYCVSDLYARMDYGAFRLDALFRWARDCVPVKKPARPLVVHHAPPAPDPSDAFEALRERMARDGFVWYRGAWRPMRWLSDAERSEVRAGIGLDPPAFDDADHDE